MKKLIKKLAWCSFTWIAFPFVWLIIVPIGLAIEYKKQIPFDLQAYLDLLESMLDSMLMRT